MRDDKENLIYLLRHDQHVLRVGSPKVEVERAACRVLAPLVLNLNSREERLAVLDVRGRNGYMGSMNEETKESPHDSVLT